MARYVKICPRDGHRNPETAHVCEVCGEFLGAIAPQEEVAAPEREPEVVGDVDEIPAADGASQGEQAPTHPTPPQSGSRPTRAEAPGALLYLENSFSQEVYPVRCHDMLGREDPDSPAQVRIRPVAGCPSIEEIHRRHCVFEFDAQQWWLIPLDQQEFGGRFTNTTSVNARPVRCGQRHALHDGDVLRFSHSGVGFNVRIL
jgi:hypothetical protein